MARKHRKSKPKTFFAGRAVFVAISIAVAAAGTIGWLRGDGDLTQRLPFAFLAAAAGFVIPICAGQIARGFLAAALPALVFSAWSAYSIEHANETLVEAPRKAQHELAQAPVLEGVRKADALLTELKEQRATFKPEVVNCDPCRQTKKDAAIRDANRRADLDKIILIAEADVTKANLILEQQPKYNPLAPWQIVLAFGALVDLVIAVGIGVLEASARSEQRRADKENEKKKARARTNRAAKKRDKPEQGEVTTAEHKLLLRTRGPHLRVVRSEQL